MMIGHITRVVDAPTIREAAGLGLPEWPLAPADGPVFIRIEPEIISGRWFSSAGAATPVGP